MTGARLGAPTTARRLIARAAAQNLAAFVIPDVRTARAFGLDVAAAGLHPAATPRHASVLLIIGELPPGLAEGVAMVYAQMPRPRAILALGTTDHPPTLPVADVVGSLDQAGLEDAVTSLRRFIKDRSWSSSASVFTTPVHDETDPQDDGDPHAAMSHDGMHHGDHMMMGHGDHPEDQTDHMEMGHGGHMMDHDMSDGFMSMIAMTRDLPRSRDGLPMEWVEVPFGPLFPGLPGGLAPTLVLDGATVATAKLTTGYVHRNFAASLPGPVATFPDRIASLDPLTPVAYRILAQRALDAMSGVTSYHWIGAVERGRAISHLGWLAAFGELLGAAWLAKRAAALQLALARAPDVAGVRRLRPEIDRLLRATNRLPLLSRRLTGIGTLRRDVVGMVGPVARATGVDDDARATDKEYLALGFAPILHRGGDALARLQVRMAEIAQSLDFVATTDAVAVSLPPVPDDLSGTGMATIETPRGVARLHLEVDRGRVQMAHVETPSAVHAALLQPVTEGAELGDALVGIASLDLSPWEIDQ